MRFSSIGPGSQCTYLFPRVKKHLRGAKFGNEEEVVKDFFMRLRWNFFYKWNFGSRKKICNLKNDYVENKIILVSFYPSYLITCWTPLVLIYICCKLCRLTCPLWAISICWFAFNFPQTSERACNLQCCRYCLDVVTKQILGLLLFSLPYVTQFCQFFFSLIKT